LAVQDAAPEVDVEMTEPPDLVPAVSLKRQSSPLPSDASTKMRPSVPEAQAVKPIKVTKNVEVDIEEWEDRILTQIFLATVQVQLFKVSTQYCCD